MAKIKAIPTKKQEEAFKAVVKAIKAASKAGLVFYGKQGKLVAYTKHADDYANSFGFEESLRNPGSQIDYLSADILTDSGADDYSRFAEGDEAI